MSPFPRGFYSTKLALSSECDTTVCDASVVNVTQREDKIENVPLLYSIPFFMSIEQLSSLYDLCFFHPRSQKCLAPCQLVAVLFIGDTV